MEQLRSFVMLFKKWKSINFDTTTEGNVQKSQFDCIKQCDKKTKKQKSDVIQKGEE